jgi:hypothetical protein
MHHEAFIKGDFDTKFIENYFEPEMLESKNDSLGAIAAFGAGNLFYQQAGSKHEVKEVGQTNWQLKRKN